MRFVANIMIVTGSAFALGCGSSAPSVGAPSASTILSAHAAWRERAERSFGPFLFGRENDVGWVDAFAFSDAVTIVAWEARDPSCFIAVYMHRPEMASYTTPAKAEEKRAVREALVRNGDPNTFRCWVSLIRSEELPIIECHGTVTQQYSDEWRANGQHFCFTLDLDAATATDECQRHVVLMSAEEADREMRSRAK